MKVRAGMGELSRQSDRDNVWPIIRERCTVRAKAISAMRSFMMHAPHWPDDRDECFELAIIETENWYAPKP